MAPSNDAVPVPKIKPPVVWRTFALCILISFGQFVGAYESVIIGTTLQKKDFMTRMGLWNSEGKPTPHYDSLEGAIVGLFQAGAVFGTIISAIIMDRWGRKAGLLFGSVVALPAIAGLTGCMNYPELLVFRFLAGLGTWASVTAASAYIPELAPPAYRGFFAGLNGVVIGGGVAFSSYIGMAFYFAHDPVVQWRAPMGIPLFAPLLILCSLPFLPESPRYLLLKGRPEEARRIYDKLNEGPAEFLEWHEEEFSQMQQQAAYDCQRDNSWKALFTIPTYRKRVLYACLISIMNQSTGVLVISNYGQTFYKALGFGPAARQILQGNRDILALIGNLLGSLVVDRVGRKAILLFAFGGCFLCLLFEAIMVALYADTDNSAGKNAGVAFLYIFLIIYASGIDLGTYVYLGEMFPNHIRVKGVGVSLAAMQITATILLTTTNKAFTALGWKYFLVFMVVTVCGMIWIVICLPETRRLPLEEIEAVFGNKEDTMVILSADNPHVHVHEHEQIHEHVGQEKSTPTSEHVEQ